MPAIALTFLGAGGSLLCYPRRGLVPTLCGLLAAACLSADLAWFALYSGVVQGEKRLLFLLPVLVCISAALAHLLQHLQGNTGKKANHPAADTPIEQARVYLAYGRRNEAQALIRKALSREPGNAELIAALQRLERGEDLGSR
ncbi:hypothetical protein [Chitinimonas sp.]|uniref:hypothetical protein n=1 Tax=Chitinimonas sp. TaxID=1934313 RepID=UPI0035ADB602